MKVFDTQGRLAGFQEGPIPNGLVTISQKPVTDFAKNEFCSNLQLHNSAFILGSEEKIPEVNSSSAFTFNKSWQNRFCFSVSQNRKAKNFLSLPLPLSGTILIWEILNMI
jgi:hypothetical protein